MRWPWAKKKVDDVQPAAQLIDGPQGCLATVRAIDDGFGVYYMWRSEPCNEADSGWAFAHGSEDDEYINNPSNNRVYQIQTIAELHPEIVPHLNERIGAAFRWDGSKFVADPLGAPADPASIH